MRIEQYTLAQVHKAILLNKTLTRTSQYLNLRRTTLSLSLKQYFHQDDVRQLLKILFKLTPDEARRLYKDQYDKPMQYVKWARKRDFASSFEPTESKSTKKISTNPALSTQGLFKTSPKMKDTPIEDHRIQEESESIPVCLFFPSLVVQKALQAVKSKTDTNASEATKTPLTEDAKSMDEDDFSDIIDWVSAMPEGEFDKLLRPTSPF